jgi:serine/threonine protein kinase
MQDDEALAFESHLKTCPTCLASVADQTRESPDEPWLQIFRQGAPATGIDSRPLSPPAEPGFRYRWTRCIGRGGSGEVWEAWDQILRRPVAIKRLRSDTRTLHESQRLLQEATALARFSHPHIVNLHEVEESDYQPALIMELVPGPSLAAWLHGQPGTPTAAARLLEQLCQAVEHAHAQGVVHRDLKPSNILLKPTPDAPEATDNNRLELCFWCPKIADFGLAKLIDLPNLTLSGQQIGTPSYMAPEQILPGNRTAAADPLVDVYGLGAVLYELLTGRPPFVSSDPALTMAMILREEPVSPRALVPAIPGDLETICLKCLNKEPQRRYQSAAELRSDLVAFLDNQPISARPFSRAQKLFNWCRRHPAESFAIVATSALLLALTLGSLWYAALQNQLSRESLAKAQLATEKQLLQEKNSTTVREKFDQLLQAHYNFVSMLDDPNAMPTGDLSIIRRQSLINGGEHGLLYLDMLDQSLESGRQPSAEEIRVAIGSLAMALRADVGSELEDRIRKLQTLFAGMPAGAFQPPERLEMEVRIHHLQANACAKAKHHIQAGDEFCAMADLIEQQALNASPSDPYRSERWTVRVGMLLNARLEYLADNRTDLALAAVQQAEQTGRLLVQANPANLSHLALFLEVRLCHAQLLPHDQASGIATEALEIVANTQWDSPANAAKVRALEEHFRHMIR